jgi:Ca2+/H+ antiporter
VREEMVREQSIDRPNIVLLSASLAMSRWTCALERTDILLGAVHLLLFLAHLMLIFLTTSVAVPDGSP